jgi:hypothetical protein
MNLPIKTSPVINVIDIEASGFGPDSYPIEIGIAMADGSEYQTLVRPEPEWWHWDRDAQSVHGISRADLFKYGRPIGHVCRDINRLCAGATLYSDCWVHDSRWFRRLFDTAEIPALAQCKAIEYLLNDELQVVYQVAKRRVASQLGLPMHRALNDATIIQQTLEKLIGKSAIEPIEILQPVIASAALQERQMIMKWA